MTFDPTAQLSTATSTAGPPRASSSPPIASARAFNRLAIPSDSVLRDSYPTIRIGYSGVMSTTAAPTGTGSAALDAQVMIPTIAAAIAHRVGRIVNTSSS